MVISKNLREYVEETISKKIRKKRQEIWKQKQDTFDTIKDELNAIQAKAIEKCVKIIEEKGLIPEDFGYHLYGDGGFHVPMRRTVCERVSYRGERAAIQDVLLKIELEEVPKKAVMRFVENYDISSYLEED